MIGFNSNVTGTQQVNTSNTVQGVTNTNSVSTNSNPYTATDSLQTTNYSTPSTTSLTSYPVSQIMSEDPNLANRFSKFFLGSSNTLLKLGTNWLGKAFINLIAGNVPLFTSNQASLQISNNISTWVSRSDLVRTGATPYQAALLQDAGIRNVNDLATVTNMTDQAILASRMTTASIARGQAIAVSPANVSAWVNSSLQLPKYF